MKKFNANMAWTTIIVAISIITFGVLLFKTELGKKIWEGLVWFYNGLVDFNWEN